MIRDTKQSLIWLLHLGLILFASQQQNSVVQIVIPSMFNGQKPGRSFWHERFCCILHLSQWEVTTLRNSMTWYTVWLEHRKFYLSMRKKFFTVFMTETETHQWQSVWCLLLWRKNQIMWFCDRSRPKVLVQVNSINSMRRSVCLFKARFCLVSCQIYFPVPMT